MAGARRQRNHSTSIVIPRQNSTSDSGKPRQNLNAETLAAMSKEQLRAECRKRGQKSSGNKNELLSRLGYYKLAANSQPEVEPKPRNGVHPPKEISVKPKPAPMETDNLVLWRRPITTVEYFLRELFILVTNGLQKLFAYKVLALSIVLSVIGTTVSYYVEGPHQEFVHSAVYQLCWCGWWVILGVCSSVGLGTGLHTFLLYLGPHIARVTLAAYECGGLNFPQPPYPNEIICPTEVDPNYAVSIWAIMSKVRLESMMWGVGTALGELPPYFMAKAYRLAGNNDVAELKTDAGTFIGSLKLAVQNLVQRAGFMGILACASIPNPLFDLAGFTCGHFLVPFWTFFGATVIGKAVIKMHLQKMFVIIAFNETLVEQAIAWVERVPYIGPELGEPLLEFLRNQKAKLHRNSSETIDNQGSVLSSSLETAVLIMVLYFVVSIVNALAQNYSKRISKKKGKKKE